MIPLTLPFRFARTTVPPPPPNPYSPIFPGQPEYNPKMTPSSLDPDHPFSIKSGFILHRLPLIQKVEKWEFDFHKASTIHNARKQQLMPEGLFQSVDEYRRNRDMAESAIKSRESHDESSTIPGTFYFSYSIR